MKQLRFYLLIKIGPDWISKVFKDLEELLLVWKQYSGRSDIYAVVHVGINRDSVEEYESIASNFIGNVLFTAGARWILNSYGDYAPMHAGVVNGVPIYVAIDGWGYSISAASLGLDDDILNSTKDSFVDDFISSSEWLELLSLENKPLSNKLKAFGINCDKEYLLLEHSLMEDTRLVVGKFRFNVLTKGRDFIFNPIEILDYYPPSLLSLNIQNIGLSVRAFNCLNSVDIKKIEDLKNFNAAKLMNIPNFGKTTLADLRKCLYETINKIDILVAPKNISNKTAVEEYDNSYLKSFQMTLEFILSKLNEKSEAILKLRMGLNCDSMTLQEVGEQFGFSRERARQIESKAIAKIKLHSFWEGTLERKINELINSREDALNIMSLEILDEWFEGATSLESPMRFIFKHFLNDRLNIIKANGQIIISRVNQDEWDLLAKNAIIFLENGINKWTIEEAKNQIFTLLPVNGDELKYELWNMLNKIAYFSEGDEDERILIGVGQSTSVLVETVLNESKYPLHFMDITRKLSEKFHINKDHKTIHNILQDSAYRFGPGTYGFLKHSPISLKELDVIRDKCENIIQRSDPSRQWSCAELLSILQEEDIDFEEKVNIYIVNMALIRSSELSNLRRMVWTASSNQNLNANHRIDLAQAVETFLKDSGKPMSTSEIKHFIKRERGLGDTFQIHQTQSIIRLGEGIWGLIDRDLPITVSEQATLVKDIEDYLRNSERGIHITEISEILSEINNSSKTIKDPTIFFALAQRSGQMRISTGKYLFLTEWGDARRLTTSEAIRRAVLKLHPNGMKVGEIAQEATKLLGREVKTDHIYPKLSELGVNFNEQAAMWYLIENSDEIYED